MALAGSRSRRAVRLQCRNRQPPWRWGISTGTAFRDLAVENGVLSILQGDGTGKFTDVFDSGAVTGNSYVIQVGDFNGDGKQDVASASPTTNGIAVLLGDGAGHLSVAAGSPYADGGSPFSLVATDFDADGVVDMATANLADNNVTVLLGLMVGSTAQNITFGSIGNVNYGVAPFTVSATASSGLAVSFASASATVCTVSGSTVTIIGGGTCTIVASQGGDATYAAAATVT